MAAPENSNDLQSAFRLNAELVETVQQQKKTIEQLREQLALYRRKLFGNSSERFADDESQLRLFKTGNEQDRGGDETENEQDEDSKPKRRRRKKKSEKIPDHLRRKVIEADVSPEERMCSSGGDEMPIIGTDVTERVDLIPAELFAWEIRRHKRACGKCKDTIVQVPAAEEHNGEDLFARAGMLIPRNMQFVMLPNIAELITGLLDLMKQRVVSGSVIGADDTSVRVQDASLPDKMRTVRFWLYRGRDGPASFLKDFSGHAVVDAYGVHEGVAVFSRFEGVAEDRIFAARCHSHARRKLIESSSKRSRMIRLPLRRRYLFTGVCTTSKTVVGNCRYRIAWNYVKERRCRS